MSLAISRGHFAITTAHANKMMFFISVCVLVSTMASPKHPQSFTGLATAIHKVSTVMTTITAVTMRLTIRRCMANKRYMPKANSKAANITDAVSVAQSGIHGVSPMASR